MSSQNTTTSKWKKFGICIMMMNVILLFVVVLLTFHIMKNQNATDLAEDSICTCCDECEQMECYFDNVNTYISQQWGCWEPPSCYQGQTSTSICIIQTGSSNPGGDQCGTMKTTYNSTNSRFDYTCTYKYIAPTPPPTPEPTAILTKSNSRKSLGEAQKFLT